MPTDWYVHILHICSIHWFRPVRSGRRVPCAQITTSNSGLLRQREICTQCVYRQCILCIFASPCSAFCQNSGFSQRLCRRIRGRGIHHYQTGHDCISHNYSHNYDDIHLFINRFCVCHRRIRGEGRQSRHTGTNFISH